MYDYMQEISVAAYDILCHKFEAAINEIDYYVQERESLLSQAETAVEDGKHDEATLFRNEAYVLSVYTRLARNLDEWLSRIPILGFNSGKYDMNVIRRYLFPHFIEHGIEVSNIIKKGNMYMCMYTPHAIFLDVCSFVAAGTSYSSWLKANDVDQGKGFFPYAWLTDLSKLDQTSLPPIEEFWSELKQIGIKPEDYEYLQEVWVREGFRTMRDLLVWYNVLDVVPFLAAAEKMFNLWKGIGIDAFKSGAISLPGLALAYLTREMQPHTILPLYDSRNKDIYETIRDNITGGLAIVMHRYHEKDVTLLPNGKPVGWVYSHDANALYLWGLAQETGTGLFGVWRGKTGSGTSLEWLRPDKRDRTKDAENRQKWDETVKANMAIKYHRTEGYPYCRSEVNWLEYTAYKTGRKIEHRFNGRPKTVFVAPKMNYRLDGYHRESNTAYQFHGCYFHSHGCRLDSEKDPTKREVRRRQTDEMRSAVTGAGMNLVEMWECEWIEMKRNDPTIGQFLEENLNLKVKQTTLTGEQIVEMIEDGRMFGLIELDLEVPYWDDELLDYFEEFPPIFKSTEVGRSELGDHMRVYAEERGYMKKPSRCLLNSFFARKIMLTTPLVRWYLQHGLRISRIYQVIEMVPKRCFAEIAETVTGHRRRADQDPAHKSAAESWKTLGNSFYGKTMTRKDRFKDTVLVDDVKAARLVNDKRFNKLEEVGDIAYEITEDKTKIKIDMPISVAFFTYNWSKLRMLDYVYGFLKRYMRPGSYQLCCSDTDSILAAFESENLDDLVKPELREEYFRIGKPSFMVTDEYSKRTPGLMKVERSGTLVIALCSKTYFHWNGDDDVKISSKGLSKTTNSFKLHDFLDVLRNKVKGCGTNYGFKVVGDKVVQYKQDREGLAYLYAKRRVLDDGVSTRALYI